MTTHTKTPTLGSDGKVDLESTTKLVVVRRDTVEFIAADNEPIQARAEVAILPEGTYIKVSDVVALTERTICTLQKYVGASTDLWRQCSLVPQQRGIWPAFMPVEQAMAVVKDIAVGGPTVPLALQFLRAIKRTADAAAEGRFTGVWANELPASKWKQYEKLLRKRPEEETPEPDPEPEYEPEPEEPEPEPEEPPTIEGSDNLYLRLGQRIADMQRAKTEAEEICRELGIAPPWAQ